MSANLLEVVDDNDEVIGVQPRSKIHALGLRHREVHVWFVTDENEVIFQRRSLTKDTYPGLLDATVGGHVEIGQSYDQAALAETREETGLVPLPEQLRFLAKLKTSAVDAKTGKKNDTFRQIYWLRHHGQAADLHIENEAGAGFVVMPLDRVLAMTETQCGDCISDLFKAGYKSVWTALHQALV